MLSLFISCRRKLPGQCVLDEFAEVKETIRVKECLEAGHPCHTRAMLFDHESSLHQTNDVLTRGCPFPCVEWQLELSDDADWAFGVKRFKQILAITEHFGDRQRVRCKTLF